jgi:hypothetical protein
MQPTCGRKSSKRLGAKTGVKALAFVPATAAQPSQAATVTACDGHCSCATSPRSFQVKAGRILHEVVFEGSKLKASQNLKVDEALSLPTDFGMIRDRQLSNLLALIQRPEFKQIANDADPVPGEEFSLFTESGIEKISIGLRVAG